MKLSDLIIENVGKATKASSGYMVPPVGVEFACRTCKKFRPPASCSSVGKEDELIFPEGCCNHWEHDGAKKSTRSDPNPRNY